MSEQSSTTAAGATGVADRNGPARPAPAVPRPAAKASLLAKLAKHKWLVLVALVAVAGLGCLAWIYFRPPQLPEGFAMSNGRIEATEIDIATKLAERLAFLSPAEGDYVNKDQVVARMETDTLEPSLRGAHATLREAETSEQTAEMNIEQRLAEKEAADATVKEKEAELRL